MVITDVTEWPADGWPQCFPIGGHLRKGRHFLRALQDIVARESAWTVAHGFEVFETYVKDVSALYLKRNATALTSTAWMRRRRKDVGACPTTRRIAEYRAFVGAAYRGVEDLIKRLRATIPEITDAEHRNVPGLDFETWLRAAAEVRHATVHGQSIIPHSRLLGLGPLGITLLKSCFPGRGTAGGYRVMLEEKAAGAALEVFAEYALLIFKAASAREGLDFEVFRRVSIRV